MKKLLLSFTAVLLIWTTNNTGYTQAPESYVRLKPHTSFEKHIPLSKQPGLVKSSVLIYRNNISTRAVRNFIRNYENISDVKWYSSGDGFVVHFIMNGIKTRVHYLKNGEFRCMLRYYHEDKLAPEIRKQVKSKYYDFNICCITELYMNGQTTYEIKMEDKFNWKIIRVAKGELESVADFRKP